MKVTLDGGGRRVLRQMLLVVRIWKYLHALTCPEGAGEGCSHISQIIYKSS